MFVIILIFGVRKMNKDLLFRGFRVSVKIAGGIFLGIMSITSLYGLNFYHAEKVMKYAKGVRIKRNFGYMEYGDGDTCEIGFIFYPGGKVGLNAYGELLTRVAQKDIFCVVCGMPVNLAVLNPNSADKYIKKYAKKFPNIKKWYIGGHSLGGTIACKHAVNRPGVYEGVVFLAAHPDKNDDMNKTDMRALSIYGSLDSVLSRERYSKYHDNFKMDMDEIVIEGGNHGNFGAYGFQNGDHTSTIDKYVQIDKTAEYIADFIKRQL